MELGAEAELPGACRVLVQPDPEALAGFAAATLAAAVAAAVAERGVAVVALPGGQTPRRFLELLAGREDVDWPRVVLLPADERAVPPTDPRSNEGMIRACLLDRIRGPRPRFLSWGTGSGSEVASLPSRFEAQLLQLGPSAGPQPALDLCVLGMGGDGHTASLFPGREYDRQALTLASVSPTGEPRLSLGPAALRSARRLALLLQGEDKSTTLQRVVEGPYQPWTLPAQLAARRPGGGEVWCDAAAAAGLARG